MPGLWDTFNPSSVSDGSAAPLGGGAGMSYSTKKNYVPSPEVRNSPLNSYIPAVQGFEGFAPRAGWDYRQYTNGYGTRALYPGEVIDRDTASQRFNNEWGNATSQVDAFAPNAPAGVKAALSSLTFNAGPKWMQSGLGQAVRSGDYQTAKNIFLQYNRAGGEVNPGLVSRRQQEAYWFDNATPPDNGAPPDGRMSLGGPIPSQTEGQPMQGGLLSSGANMAKFLSQGAPITTGSISGNPDSGGGLISRSGAASDGNGLWSAISGAGGSASDYLTNLLQNPLFQFGLGVAGAGTEGKGLGGGLLAGSKNAASAFEYAKGARDLQMMKQRDAFLKQINDPNSVLSRSLSPQTRAMLGSLPADQAADAFQRIATSNGSDLAQAQTAEARASAARSAAEVQAMQRQAGLLNHMLPEFFGGDSSTGQPTASAMPGASDANPGAPGGLLRSGASASPVGATPPPASLPAVSSGAPGIVVAPNDPASSPSEAPAPASTALPRPGDPTSFTGASASGMTTPSRLSPDTMRAAAFDLALNGGKGMSSIINNDPGSKYASTYATKTAEDNASLNFKQKMTAPLLDQLHHMRDLAVGAGKDVLGEAIGPDYTEGTDPNSWIPNFSMDTSGQRYQNLRSWGQALNLPGRALQYLSPDSAAAPYPTDVYDNAAKLNLQMQHIKKGLGAAVKALPGSKGGGASTDQDQALVLDAVGEALHAQDPETFFKILHDAENLLRGRAGMPALEAPQSYIPAEWSKTASGTPAPSATPSSVGSPAGSSRADASSTSRFAEPPAAAIAQLRQDTSAKNRAYFDQIFGPGASARAIGGQR